MAEMKMEFDLLHVKTSLSAARKDDGEILMDDYLIAYTELSRFFELLGTLFQFVLNDVRDKISILEQHRTGEHGANYMTVDSMINYEVEIGITKVKGKLPSGSRTLLRLHRAMEFIMVFLRDITRASPDEKLSTTAGNAYNGTLSKHHTWIIRKAVGVALYALPTRNQLLERLKHESEEETVKLLGELVDICEQIYQQINQLYTDNDLLDLP